MHPWLGENPNSPQFADRALAAGQEPKPAAAGRAEPTHEKGDRDSGPLFYSLDFALMEKAVAVPLVLPSLFPKITSQIRLLTRPLQSQLPGRSKIKMLHDFFS